MNTKTLSLFVWMLACISALTGCAGNGLTPVTTPGAFAGDYSATVGLDAGKSGSLALSVDADGKADGSLTVSAPSQPEEQATFSFTTAVISVSGQVNNDGSFSLNGSDPTSGSFSIGGSLPVSANSHGSIQVSAGGAVYSSTISVVQGTGGSTITFVNSGAPIDTSPFPPNPYILISSAGGNSGLLAVPSSHDPSRSLGMTMDPSIQTGTVINILEGNTVNLLYHEQAAEGVDWRAKAGTIRFISRSASSIEVKFEDVVFASEDAPGTFKINGTLKK